MDQARHAGESLKDSRDSAQPTFSAASQSLGLYASPLII